MTLQDFVIRAEECIYVRDLDGLAAVISELQEQNPAAADELAQACAAEYQAMRAERAPDPDDAWAGMGCGAWRKAPRIIGGPSHTHVCRRAPGHEGPHACHSGDLFRW